MQKVEVRACCFDWGPFGGHWGVYVQQFVEGICPLTFIGCLLSMVHRKHVLAHTHTQTRPLCPPIPIEDTPVCFRGTRTSTILRFGGWDLVFEPGQPSGDGTWSQGLHRAMLLPATPGELN